MHRLLQISTKRTSTFPLEPSCSRTDSRKSLRCCCTPYNVRDPSYPKQPDQMSESELRAPLQDFNRLNDGRKVKDEDGEQKDNSQTFFYFFAFLSLLAQMITMLRPVVSLHMATSLSRSALFLVAFLVVHASGNMTVFGIRHVQFVRAQTHFESRDQVY